MNREFKKLQKERDVLTNKVNAFCDDFGIDESREDLWNLINSIVENEIEQEEMCGE